MNLPTQLTVLRILLTPIVVSLLFLETTGFKIAALIVFIIASLTDWYDGYFARKSGIITMWGQFLDPLADKILVSSALICFSILGYVQAWMVMIIIIRDLIITAVRSYALVQHQQVHTNFFGKVKTSGQIIAIYFIFIYYLMTWQVDLTQSSGFIGWVYQVHFIHGLMMVITIVTLFSGSIYIFENRVLIRKAFVNLFRIFIPTDV